MLCYLNMEYVEKYLFNLMMIEDLQGGVQIEKSNSKTIRQ